MMNELVQRKKSRKFWIPNTLDRRRCPFAILLQDVEGFRSSFPFLSLFFFLFFFFFFLYFTSFGSDGQEWKVLRDVCLLCFRFCHLGRRPNPVVYPSKSVPTNRTDWLCIVVAELTQGYVDFRPFFLFFGEWSLLILELSEIINR